MTYASDRLYNEVVRRNLARYATDVKVREILPYLPCLTLTDKEEVEAKKDSAGNYAAVQMLLDNLRRRENWPEDFIAALRSCEHRKLADELSDAYDKIRGRTNNAAAAPAQAPPDSTTPATTTVTTATVHTAPVTTPTFLTPPSGNAPAQTSAPSNVAAQIPPPASDLQQEQQEKASTPAASLEPPSQPEVPPPAVVSSPAPLPTIVSDSKVDSTVQQNKVPIQVGATGQPNGRTTTSLTADSIFSTLSAQASSSSTSLSQPRNSPSTSQNSQKSEKDQMPLAVEETLKTLPVQETNPPSNKEPEECSDPTINEIVQSTNRVGLPVKAQITSTRTPQATPSVPAEVVPVSQEYFSKPGILLVPGEEEPCSTTTNDLEISHTPEPSAEPVQSGSFPSSINESSNLPQEDHYESSCESQMEILTNVVRFAEESSAENLNGQPPSMLGNAFNPCSGNLQHSARISEDKPVQNYENAESGKPSGRDALRPSDQERSTSINYQEQGSNVLYLSAAAAAAAVSIGLFVVWKIKS